MTLECAQPLLPLLRKFPPVRTNTVTVENLAQTFNANADKIAEQLIACFGLAHSQYVEHLARPLLRWLDFRLRVIDPRPRAVHLSNRFPKQLDEPYATAFRKLVEAISTGEDINAFQGKGIVRGDSSGKKRSERTDLLWADWGIHHLHIAKAPDEREGYFSARSDFLLFVVFGHDVALLLDIQPHSGDDLRFVREDLIKLVAQDWPSALEPFELKGVLAPARVWTEAERKKLRASGLDAPLIIDGKVYFSPGQGVTTASTPGRVTHAMMRLSRNLQALAQQVLEPDSQFRAELAAPTQLEGAFALELSPKGVILHSKYTDRGWTFPDAKFDGTDSLYAEIADALTPPWVKDAIRKSLSPPAHRQKRRKPTLTS